MLLASPLLTAANCKASRHPPTEAACGYCLMCVWLCVLFATRTCLATWTMIARFCVWCGASGSLLATSGHDRAHWLCQDTPMDSKAMAAGAVAAGAIAPGSSWCPLLTGNAAGQTNGCGSPSVTTAGHCHVGALIGIGAGHRACPSMGCCWTRPGPPWAGAGSRVPGAACGAATHTVPREKCTWR